MVRPQTHSGLACSNCDVTTVPLVASSALKICGCLYVSLTWCSSLWPDAAEIPRLVKHVDDVFLSKVRTLAQLQVSCQEHVLVPALTVLPHLGIV